MSNPALRMTPREGAESWTVSIDMPVWPSGKDRGRPVGWITSNNSHTESKVGGIVQTKKRQLWREKAYAEFLRHRVPKYVGRVQLTFTWVFVNGRHPETHNPDGTRKPIIDALTPYRTEMRKGKPVHFKGVGTIPDDNDRWVVIGPQQPIPPYLGAGSRIGGRVIVTITPITEDLPIHL